jgi:nitrite reductase/ring-hydroxylating ferredoxin subunit
VRSIEQSQFAGGTWLKHRAGETGGLRQLHARVASEIVRAVAEVKGPSAERVVEERGLEMLHAAIEPLDLGPIRDRVLERLRGDLLRAAVGIGRDVMDWDGEFYVDDYLIVRINLPYEIAKHADPAAENPGIGRITPSMREIAAARKVRDPVYDPKGYHRGHPPAAWAHGPHRDSWAGHSTDGLNVWWAISDVPADAGVVFYPQLTGEPLRCDPRTLYLQNGQQLPAPTFVPMAAGEMLIFDPEILHGTHLNVSARTRVAVSMRLNARKPTFDPTCFYAREFWRRASDIESGERDEVLHLKREEHLSAAAAPVQAPRSSSVPVIDIARGGDEVARGGDDGAVVEVGPSALVPDSGRAVAAVGGKRVLLMRCGGRLRAVSAACPHYGIDLSDGGIDGLTLHCPGCALGFDVETGRSASPALTLQTFAVGEDGGTIRLDLAD